MKKSKDYNDRYIGCNDYDRIPATGTIKQIAEAVEKDSVKIRDLLVPSSWPGLGEARSALEGNRWNGVLKKAGTLFDIFGELTFYLKGLVEVEKDVKKKRQQIKKLISLFDKYKICPECNGEMGELLGPNYWTDCDECGGEGMIQIK